MHVQKNCSAQSYVSNSVSVSHQSCAVCSICCFGKYYCPLYLQCGTSHTVNGKEDVSTELNE